MRLDTGLYILREEFLPKDLMSRSLFRVTAYTAEEVAESGEREQYICIDDADDKALASYVDRADCWTSPVVEKIIAYLAWKYDVVGEDYEDYETEWDVLYDKIKEA